MKIFSEKVNYSISALFELASNSSAGSLQAQQIADAQKIPKNYLVQLLIILKKAGFVDSVRGINGGYQLAKSPQQILIVDVIESLEGPISILEHTMVSDLLSSFWSQVEKDLKQLLSISLEDLINRGHEFNFQI